MVSNVGFLDVKFASILKDALVSFAPAEMKRVAQLD
jgi:hypothetical protein